MKALLFVVAVCHMLILVLFGSAVVYCAVCKIVSLLIKYTNTKKLNKVKLLEGALLCYVGILMAALGILVLHLLTKSFY